MTTRAELAATAEAAMFAAIDQAQQRYRADIAAPLADYLAATAGPRAELEAAEHLARQVYAETVNATPSPPAGP